MSFCGFCAGSGAPWRFGVGREPSSPDSGPLGGPTDVCCLVENSASWGHLWTSWGKGGRSLSGVKFGHILAKTGKGHFSAGWSPTGLLPIILS
jgi:hypothetical protein